MAGVSKKFDSLRLGLSIDEHLLDLSKLIDHIKVIPLPSGVYISQFQPWRGYAGTAMEIVGSGFSDERQENHVEIGGRTAYVIEASENRLFVLTDPFTATGPVTVTVDGDTATGPRDFEELPWPIPGSEEDGPPYSFIGRSRGYVAQNAPAPGTGAAAGDIPPTGTARVLVVPSFPTDMVPPNQTTARQAVVDTFANVTTYYNQVSYNTLSVQVDVTNFVALLEDSAYYHKPGPATGYPNIDNAVLDQLMAESAQGAVNAGFDLDDYAVMAALVYLPGLEVRAWGGWSSQNFAYSDGAGTNINLTADSPISLIAARHDADWGRAAHEFGHGLVDGGLVLGEDVYRSDLVEPDSATANDFEMMGNHDSHPLFSGFFMHQLGYFSGANVLDLQWDRNPFSREVDIVAHGLTQDSDANRYNLVRIRVSEGLYYFIEVRQQPDPSASTVQAFDGNIPLPSGSTKTGGVVVTKAITGTMNNNQETRLITLLHDPRVLLDGDVATDPLRTLQISILDDDLQARPLVCRVRIEWAQQIADTPGGDFDLRVEPWGAGWETPDIWVDRQPYGAYDSVDSGGNPSGNGDAPRPNEINRFYARIRNEGAADATSVRVTYYSVTPPGVGDNGTWAPLQTKVLGTIVNNNQVQDFVNWVPTVGEHTCLKVVAEQQLGEVSGQNNSAQENVFVFQPAASVPEPVVMTVAVRNPLEERALVHIGLDGVPRDYRVYFPHRWIYLEGLGERKLDLIIIPTQDLREMKEPVADVRLSGGVDRGYSDPLVITDVPGSWIAPIGGITARVHPKHHGSIKLEEDREASDGKDTIAVRGHVSPGLEAQRIRVDLTTPEGERIIEETETKVGGEFFSMFDLTRVREKELEPDKLGSQLPMRKDAALKRHDGGPVRRVYEVQAHILNAQDVAPAHSNLVYFER